jgi:hypothetical protein
MIRVYSQPDFASQRLGWRRRDQLLWLYDELTSPAGPPRNPTWYHIDAGYVHSAYLQRVERQHLNLVPQALPATPFLAEVTVPYTPTFHYTSAEGWQPLYRLYYQSLHWVTGFDPGPNGLPWYRLTDHLLYTDYHANARHLRLVPPEEYSPIHPNVPAEDKEILVSIENQTLTACEAGQPVFQARISSGLPDPHPEPGELSTETPLGSFRIQTKMPSRHMGNGELTSDIAAYELPGVPWTMIFHETGVALHGAYWHNNFGTRMSHGCINLRIEDARWLFRWTDPPFTTQEHFVRQPGTRLFITL